MGDWKKRLSDEALWHVGAYLLNWGRLETRISWSIAEMAPHATGPQVNPANVARALEAITNKWFTVYCETTAAQIQAAKRLKSAIQTASKDRNNICHGLGGIWLDPDDYAVICWQQYHQHKMTGNNPPQRTYDRAELAEMCGMIGDFEREINRLTELAIARPRTSFKDAAKVGTGQTRARQL